MWNPDAVHLLPADRSDHRVIDAERICQAIAALDRPEVIAARARQFAVLADPTRLTLLTCIRAAAQTARNSATTANPAVLMLKLATTFQHAPLRCSPGCPPRRGSRSGAASRPAGRQMISF